MTTTAPDSIPGRITYTGPLTISKPDSWDSGSMMYFNIEKAGNAASADTVQYDTDGVPHNLPSELVGKRFCMLTDDKGAGKNAIATGDKKFTDDYVIFVGCDRKLQKSIIDFAESNDDAQSKEVEGTITAQLKNPRLTPSTCLVSEGHLDTATANVSSVEETGCSGASKRWTPHDPSNVAPSEMPEQANTIRSTQAEAAEL